MKNKIIAGIIVALALSIIKMGLEYVLKAEECKADLEAFKQIEIQNKKQTKQTKIYVKKTQKQIVNNPDINFRRKLLDQIKDSE